MSVIPIFDGLISDKDENKISNDGNLFHLSKYSDKLYGNIVYKMQTEISFKYQIHLHLPQFQNFESSSFI